MSHNIVDGLRDEQVHCFVYKNLTKDCWSVRINGLVVFHALNVTLKAAAFHVSEKGRQRVLSQKCKNVHAGVRGHLVWAHVIDVRHSTFGMHTRPMEDTDFDVFLRDGQYVSYNPYKGSHFVFKDTGERATVKAGEYVVLDKDGKVTVGHDAVTP